MGDPLELRKGELRDAVHIGHSTGGGEVAHYIARHGESRVAKAVLISAVPPLMVQTDANPGSLPKSVFDDLQDQVASNRARQETEFLDHSRRCSSPSRARSSTLRRVRSWYTDQSVGVLRPSLSSGANI